MGCRPSRKKFELNVIKFEKIAPGVGNALNWALIGTFMVLLHYITVHRQGCRITASGE
jgi:hypothetical protein